jgi:nucleoside 2-deoxyribosyltransferase
MSDPLIVTVNGRAAFVPRKVYVAGPMSGLPQFNFPAFDAAAADLRDRGFTVVSPAELDDPQQRAAATASEDGDADKLPTRYEDFLARDAEYIVSDRVEAIVVLPGWEDSRGANFEVFLATSLGKPVFAYPELEPLHLEPRADFGGEAPALPSRLNGEERVVNEATGGEKGRKPQRYELVPWEAVGDIAEVYAFGASKYADHNWRRGYDWSLSFGALMRHLAAFWSGEDLDPESGLPHVAHAGFHVFALLVFMREHRELDDRFTTTDKGV